MREKDQWDLIVKGSGALIAFILIYNYWMYLMGALVVYVLAKEYFKNNNRNF